MQELDRLHKKSFSVGLIQPFVPLITLILDSSKGSIDLEHMPVFPEVTSPHSTKYNSHHSKIQD